MQKKLIALAVVAAFSTPAFADATLYGAVDAAVAQISGTNLKGDLLAVSGGAGASRVGINAAEDLDNGLKAVVNAEWGLDTQTSNTAATTAAANASATATNYSTIAARQYLLGVAGGFGTVATGYLQTTGYDWQVKFDPVAGSLVSPLQSMNKGMLVGTIAVAARAPRALAYISPNMNGLTVAVNYTTELNAGLGGVTAASNSQYVKASAYLLSATYAAGPLTVGAVMASADTGKNSNGTLNAAGTAGSAPGTKVNDMALGASYDLGVAKLMGTYQTSQVKPAAAASTTSKAMSLSAVIPAGPGMVGVQYASHKSAAANQGGSGFLVGYLLPMSKTVTAYAAYESVKNQSGATGFTADNNALAPVMGAGGSSSVMAVGLRKKF